MTRQRMRKITASALGLLLALALAGNTFAFAKAWSLPDRVGTHADHGILMSGR